ncbi:MAG: tetratricopeptide repeat protein [Lachnospiraceae bacterium]|nr:tetratricopeptide repeat protein [Lachnospiraceae bacterium]
MYFKKWLLLLCLVFVLALTACSDKQSDAIEAGITAMQDGKYEDAKVCFKAALSSKGGQRYRRMTGAAYRYLGIISYEEEDYEKAEEYLLKAVDYSDVKEVIADAFAYLGEVYERCGREDEAIQAWSKSLDRRKDEILSMKRMYLQWKTGKMSDQEAEGELNKYVSKGNVLASYYLAVVFEKGENYAQAIKIYEEAYEKDPDATLLLKIAECYHQMGDLETMMQYYEKAEGALSGDELLAVLWNEVAVFESHLDYENARAKALQYLSLAPENEAMAKEEMFLRTRLGIVSEDTSEEITTESETQG